MSRIKNVYTDGNAVYDFWRAVVEPGCMHESPSTLQFCDGKCWGWTRDVKVLYIRDCYKSFIEKVRNTDMAMVEGSPGIGKSLFIFYFIYVMVTRARGQ